jgi:thiol:disulfide interchange protein
MGLTAAALGWLLIQLGGIELLAIAGLAAVAAISLAFVLYRRQLPVLAWVAGLGLVMAVGAVRAAPVAQDHQSARSASILDPRPFSEAGLAEARATGRPVFVWFTADWCVTCKVNERIAIEREATRDAFEQAGVIAMVGDWTRRDAEISQFLSDQGVAGVPLYLYYPANAREAERLPQILGPDTLVERAGISSRPAQPRAGQ